MKLEKITFCPDGEEPVEFFVLEQTRMFGVNYILVTDFEEGDGELYTNSAKIVDHYTDRVSSYANSTIDDIKRFRANLS